jgi:hypothetical protein
VLLTGCELDLSKIKCFLVAVLLPGCELDLGNTILLT